MSPNSAYVRTSLLAILFMTLHMTDDAIRGENAQGGWAAIVVVLILVVWLYALVRLTEQRAGYIIGLVVSVAVSVPAVLHLTGIGDATLGEILAASGPFFVWVVVGLGVTALSALIFSAYLLFFPTAQKPAVRRK
jgi:hypothetical protein